MARSDQDTQQYRAAYQKDAEIEMFPRTQDDWTDYPESFYPVQGAPIPQQPLARRPQETHWAYGGTPRKQTHTALWTFVALICIALLALLGYVIVNMYQASKPFRQRAEYTKMGLFAQGVLVDNIHIGGMTRQQAEQALSQQSSQGPGQLAITIRVDDETWLLTPQELPFQRNIQSVLDTAYAIGRQGSAETITSVYTPFEYRYAHLEHTVSSPAYLYTQVTYDKARVRELVGIIENRINRDPVDAQLESFDFANRAFTFTQDQPGARLDGEALYQQLIEVLDRQEYTATIVAQSMPITPNVTRVELMNSFSRISSFTTETTSDKNRNTNVDLACRAVSGIVVMPGETFSFNNATGQRTTEKGYLPAAAIAGGTTVDEVGGGVCQVSSTLFNAAVMADMIIVTRSPHAWPSNYVDKGRDATVNWPNLDFKFRNDGDTPIFIVAYYQNRKCTVEIYGANLGPGETRQLSTQVVDITYPPEEPLYEQNLLLPPGTIQEKKKARTGYIVETYKIYLRNGAEYRREKLCTSNYKMIQQVLEWN